MEVSIVIPNYNGKKYMETCMLSLQKQTCKDFNVILVDNNSFDDSCEFIAQNYPQVKIIKLDSNYGFSAAVNNGIKQSDSKYIVLLNNDTEVNPNWLEELINTIDKNKKIFSICSKMIQYKDRDKIDDAGDEYNLLGWAYKRGDGMPIEKYSDNDQVFSSCAGAAIYRKEVFEKIGYFDEDFFAYMEDVDISYRAKIHGYKNMYCSNAIVYHIGSATSGSKYNIFKVKLAARNNIYVVYKNMPIIQLIINSPFLLVGFLIKIIFFYKKGFGKEYLSGLKEGICTLNKIEKVRYKNKNFINYIKIEAEMIANTCKYVFGKLSNRL